MISVKYLKNMLENLPDNAKLYAYEGEIIGLIVVDGDTHKTIMEIECSGDNKNEEK